MLMETLSKELNCTLSQVEAAVTLLDQGSTVPFIARYRKEATGGLDDGQLRLLEDRLSYLRTLEERKATILSSIEKQGKLTDDLAEQIQTCMSKAELEDYYLPYKPKRRTKAQIAIENGLLPLADTLLNTMNVDPSQISESYIDSEKGLSNIKQVLDGAKAILMERISENAEVRRTTRDILWQQGLLTTKIADEQHAQSEKFKDYFDYQEAIAKIPSHRALAVFRGRQLGVLQSDVILADAAVQQCFDTMRRIFSIAEGDSAQAKWLLEVLDWTWRVKLLTKLEIECLLQLREKAEADAIDVFKENLSHLLMAAPAGDKVTMGIDPGFRTGIKVVVVDETGKLLDKATLFPHAPQKKYQAALASLADMASRHQVQLVSIGNGTASRETDKLVADLIKEHPALQLQKIVVSESGASVYSASETAAAEFPDLDVTYRGAVSIARRLQDPLAELVKITPKSIGVGQYQHDVNQQQLADSLDKVVEDCVNKVGVNVNMASGKLLSRVSGLNEHLANGIVAYRESHGPFVSRQDLLHVPGFGQKTFQLAAGFLRCPHSDNPLDASAVHPESYSIVDAIQQYTATPIEQLIGNDSILSKLPLNKFVAKGIGIPTLKDIIAELNKPGRDPRPDFITAQFEEGVNEISDLQVGMQLEGTITNVTHFGAFVDIGVHQDGLVHKSQLANQFVENPHDIVTVGQIVSVRVLEIDEKRKRVSLSMRDDAKSSPKKAGNTEGYNQFAKSNTAIGQALSALFQGNNDK